MLPVTATHVTWNVVRAETIDGRGAIEEHGPQGSAIDLDAVAVGIEIDSRRRCRDLDTAGHRDARHLEGRAYGVPLHPTRGHGQRARIVSADAAVARRAGDRDAVAPPAKPLEPRDTVDREGLCRSAVHLDRVPVRVDVDSRRHGRDLDVPGCRRAG